MSLLPLGSVIPIVKSSLFFFPTQRTLPPKLIIALSTPCSIKYSLILSAIYPFATAPRSIIVLGLLKLIVLSFKVIPLYPIDVKAPAIAEVSGNFGVSALKSHKSINCPTVISKVPLDNLLYSKPIFITLASSLDILIGLVLS